MTRPARGAVPRESERSPSPLAAGDTRPFFDALERGASFREAFEALIFSLPPERADTLTQLHKESRGAWFPLVRASGGDVLIVGNSLTGSVVPLAAFGSRLTLVDPSPERLRLALRCVREQIGTAPRGVIGAGGGRLPFADAAFDLVVVEGGLGAAQRGEAPVLSECRRVTRGELFVMADNRLGYKRSSGRYRDFRVRRPLELLRGALAPQDGERTLAGYRRVLKAPGFEPPVPYALYAHRHDFAHVVALDAPRPALPIGPNEKRNRIKTAAHAAGLFPLFAPSFAFVCTRSELRDAPTRGARLLAELAKRIDEPVPEIDELTGTRGNTTVIQTARPGADPREPSGRWTLHVAMYQSHRGALDLHLETLARVAHDYPEVPVPAALHAGVVDGVRLTCERRLPGVAAHHLIGDLELSDRLLLQVADHFSRLEVRAARSFSEEDFETLLAPKFELVLQRTQDTALRPILEAMRARAAAELIGRDFPLVLCHGDLRAKHVQVDAEAQVLGYLDWGTAADPELPCLDILHLLVHDKKQQTGITDGDAWRLTLEPRGLREGEGHALDEYRDRLAIDMETACALAAIYPIVVAHTAESNWPFSRPGWFRRQFGI